MQRVGQVALTQSFSSPLQDVISQRAWLIGRLANDPASAQGVRALRDMNAQDELILTGDLGRASRSISARYEEWRGSHDALRAAIEVLESPTAEDAESVYAALDERLRDEGSGVPWDPHDVFVAAYYAMNLREAWRDFPDANVRDTGTPLGDLAASARLRFSRVTAPLPSAPASALGIVGGLANTLDTVVMPPWMMRP